MGIYRYFYDRYLINPFFKTQPSSIAESSALTTQITSLASVAFMVLVVALAVKRFLRKEINTNYQHCNGYAIRDTSVEESPKPSTFPQNIAVLVAGGCLISAVIFYGPYVAEEYLNNQFYQAHTLGAGYVCHAVAGLSTISAACLSLYSYFTSFASVRWIL